MGKDSFCRCTCILSGLQGLAKDVQTADFVTLCLKEMERFGHKIHDEQSVMCLCL